MANTITFEMTENQAKSVEQLLDETLTVLRRIEDESPAREQRIEQSRRETQTIKEEIWKQLAILNERAERLEAV
ncbi:MAG: hypothetical protein M3T96_00975 [Acidobacteriota bacterium]|nr:hypothetical protein [Acidobacteriota bacterium]